MHPINRDPEKLHPLFRPKLLKFTEAWNRNHPKTTIHLFEGFRSFDRQAYLYSLGRTIPSHTPCAHKIKTGGKVIIERRKVGTCDAHPLGAVVTNAPPGLSWHNYGCGGDLVFDGDPEKPGIDWDWDGKLPWPQMGSMAMAMGLEWAGSWRTFREYPHVQDTFGLKIQDALEIHRTSGLEGVWDMINFLHP